MKFNHFFTFDAFSKWIGVVLLPVVILTGTFITDIRFNYDIDSFYDPNDPELISYTRFKDHFENENDYILIGIRNESGIFRQDFLMKVDSLTHILERKEYFSRVISPTNLSETIISFGMPVNIPLLHIDDTSKLLTDKEKIYSGSIYNGLIFSGDEQSVSLIARIEKSEFPGNEAVVNELNSEMSRFSFTETHLAGRAITQYYYKLQMQKEMRMFVIISVLLVLFSVMIIFRSVFISFIIIISLISSLVVVYGLLGAFQYPITLIQTMLPLILLITGVSPCIHLLTQLRSQNNPDKQKALKNAYSFTFIPNTLNTFTTSLGFATLWFLPIPPIQEFAVVTSSGVLITYFVSIGILTGILSHFPIPNKKYQQESGTVLFTIFQFFIERRLLVYSVSVMMVLLSFYSFSRMEVKNNFLDDVPQGSELKSGLDFFENKFSGIRPLEIILVPKIKGDTSLTNFKLQEIKKVQSFIQTEFRAGFIFSPVNITELTNKSLNGGDKDYETIPDDSAESTQLIKKISRKKLWNKFIPVFHSASGEVRITGRTLDLGSKFYLSKTDKLKEYVQANIRYFEVYVTGASSLMDNANANITTNFFSGVLMMTAVIFIIIAVYMRSIVLALIGITVNIIPVLFVFTLLYLAGIPMKVSSALMFSVVFGIAVDDTMHFLSTFKKFRNKFPTQHALRHTINSTGLSMALTTIILTAGFSVFSLSSFESISAFGIVVATSLFIALCADLILLPVMLSELK